MRRTTFALVHGAGSDSWYWHLVAPELRGRGHDVVAPDLPCDDDTAGLDAYTDAVVESVGERDDVVLVAQSFAGFTAPLVCERVPVRRLVLLNAMVPYPGEAPGEWWDATAWHGRPLETEQDFRDVFFHDVPPPLAAEAMQKGRPQSGTPFEKPWPAGAWPSVPTTALVARDDRFFSAAFQRRVLRERLGIVPDEIDGGHLVALSRPVELAGRLDSYADALPGPAPSFTDSR